MTRDQELALLIEEQSKDDTYVVSRPVKHFSLDAFDEAPIGVTVDGEIVSFLPLLHEDVWADFEHGTESAYINQKCRCSACRRANAEGTRRRRSALTPETLKKHGTEYGYTAHKCRCQECTKAATRARAQRARKKDTRNRAEAMRQHRARLKAAA